jgi:hypothetical protein
VRRGTGTPAIVAAYLDVFIPEDINDALEN